MEDGTKKMKKNMSVGEIADMLEKVLIKVNCRVLRAYSGIEALLYSIGNTVLRKV